MIRRMYQAAADGCAEVVCRVPALERPFVRAGAHLWSRPAVGRFYQSAAHRVAKGFRRAGRPFRHLTICGAPLVLDVTEFTTVGLYFGQVIYERATTEFLGASLHSGGCFVDIGANHGYFSVLAAALVGERGRVIAFEPNPAVFAQLQKHVVLNGFEARTTLVPMALSDAPDQAARFFVSQLSINSGVSSLVPSASALELGWLSKASSIPVRVETFDRWLASSGVDRIDVLKIDVEGLEAKVVGGMSAALASNRIGAIICETVWDSPAHAALRAAGFEPRTLDEVGSLSNILYVRRGEAR